MFWRTNERQGAGGTAQLGGCKRQPDFCPNRRLASALLVLTGGTIKAQLKFRLDGETSPLLPSGSQTSSC